MRKKDTSKAEGAIDNDPRQIAMFDAEPAPTASGENADDGVLPAETTITTIGDAATSLPSEAPAADADPASAAAAYEQAVPAGIIAEPAENEIGRYEAMAADDTPDARADAPTDRIAEGEQAEEAPMAADAISAPGDEAAQKQPPVIAGEVMLVSFGSISIAPDNVWGKDVAEDEHFRRVIAVAVDPSQLDPMLVVKAGNGWAIVGDPIPLLACEKRFPEAERAKLMLPVREITGGEGHVLLQVARQALGGRAFRGMRRARLALRLREVDGEEGRSIAATLGIHPSGTTRDLRAARIEREYPVFATILERPSEAPVSYYVELRDHADQQSAPDKTMAAMVATAARLAKAAKRFTPTLAKAALGLAKPPPKPSGDRVTVGTVGAAREVTCERVPGGGVRVAMTIDAPAAALDANAAEIARWLAAAGPVVEAAS